MGQETIVLCDTDFIIEFYRNNPTIISELRKIGQQNVAVSVITVGELIFGALNKKELNQIKKDFNSLIRIDINKNISELFLKLISTYALSHKLALPDGLIAATAIENDFELYTLNTRDYRFIDGLKLYLHNSVKEKK